ncbi:hypothetical protein astrithr_8 [Salmonella phage astrithr]|uniref:Major capsid protein n=1 Tax=Salmonella phage astrithr TaxID=2713276 RepID=A0A6G8R966_9CAUD|nr:major head protein [Salmonella phage astrithr]QIN97946.1 hypothetical protein astrithr_8 [Salmonella phage astrithr]
MQVTQLYTLINNVTKEILGETAVVNEDLSNVVDIGKSIFDQTSVDNYVKKLVNHIGKVIFQDRVYAGGVPSVLMDSWEFGSVLQKVSMSLPEATENESWKLVDGQEYKQDVFTAPKVEAKFYNSKVTFEIPMSFTELQVKESFSSREQLNGFVSMITTSVENSMTVKLDALIMRAINNMTGETLVAGIGSGTAGAKTLDFTKTSGRAVNLLALYNAQADTADKVTVANALTNYKFIKFATYTLGIYADRMSKISKLFNVGGKERFTPADMRRCVLLSDFAKAAVTYLQADIQSPEMVALPQHDAVPYWQGSGTDYALSSTGIIDIKTASGETVKVPAEGSETGNTNAAILGVMFDRDAVGVANLDRRTTTAYNAKAEFYNNWYKMDAGYYNDLNENFVVFFIGETLA